MTLASTEIRQHASLGEIRINRSSRARRLSISVRPNAEVRLTIPAGISERRAWLFLEEKSEWIEKTRARIRKRHPHQLLGPDCATRTHILRLYPCSCRAITLRLAQQTIEVRYPLTLHYEAEEVQEVIRRGIEQAWRLEAQAYLPARTQHLALQTGLCCGRVSIRNARSRWGSCSVSNDISLSLHLMKLPDRLIDYIILHELCHTLHKNHGPKFHALLNQLCEGEEAALRRALKDYSTRW